MAALEDGFLTEIKAPLLAGLVFDLSFSPGAVSAARPFGKTWFCRRKIANSFNK